MGKKSFWWKTHHPRVAAAARVPDDLIRAGCVPIYTDPSVKADASNNALCHAMLGGPLGRPAADEADREGFSLESVYLLALEISSSRTSNEHLLPWPGLVVVGPSVDGERLIAAAERTVACMSKEMAGLFGGMAGPEFDSNDVVRLDAERVPPLSGRSFIRELDLEREASGEALTMSHLWKDGTPAHVAVDLPDEWIFPGDRCDRDPDLRVDTVEAEVWFRTDKDNGYVAARVAEHFENDSNLRAAAELNSCNAKILAVMISALFMYETDNSPVVVQIVGDRHVARRWAALAVTLFNYLFTEKR